jgi:CubicO group peptidase (beta-lactamase class C family)
MIDPRADERSAAASATIAGGEEPRDGAAARAKGLAPGEAPLPSEGTIYQVGDLGRRIVEFAERTEAVGFSGALLAAKGGKVVAAVGIGTADVEGKVPNTPATLFEIASATKTFTAAATVRLAQDGRLRLDDAITLHLPGVPRNCRDITVRHLLQHTSGIPGTNTQGHGDDLGRVLPSFLRGGPIHPPGKHWEYWNQGYSLLSEVIARASGQGYTEYCKGTLFTAAHLDATRFTGDPAPAGATVAVGRSAYGPPRSALSHPYGNGYGFQYRGMGGLVTTVWDLWRWDVALRGTDVLSNDSKAELFRPGLGEYALGWFVRKGARGRSVQSHGGSVRGFVCEVRRYPEQDGCLFVLCNRDDAPARQVAQAVEELLFDDRPTVVELPRPLEGDLAKALTGRYKDAKGATLIIEADGKVTRARIEWYERGPVTRAVLGRDAGDDVVLYEWIAATKLAIDREGTGIVSRVSILGRQFSRDR